MLEKIWNYINKSIKYRLFFYLILITVIPLVVIQSLSMITSQRALHDVLVSSAKIEVENILSNMERILLNVERICNSIENNISFQQKMRSEYDSLGARYSQELEANMELNSIVGTHEDIYGLYLLGDNQLCCKSIADSFVRTDYTDDTWFVSAQKDGNSEWYSLHEDSFVVRTIGKKFISYCKPYMDKATAKNNGVMVVDIEESAITDIINQKVAQDGFFILMNEEQEIFYSSNSAFKTEEVLGEVVKEIGESIEKSKDKTEGTVTTISRDNALIVYQQSTMTNWTLVGVVPQEYVKQSLQNIIYMMFLMLVMVVILSAFIASFLARKFTEPIVDIKEAMQVVEKGNLSVQITPKGDDEIAELSHSFNHMVVRVRRLVDSIYEKQEALRKSELKALQAQINPHFLYNSLDSIVWLLRMKRGADAIMILQNLTVLFRIFLSKGHEMIPVSQEMRHLDSYLVIQSMRYSKKFTYSIDIPLELQEFYTLKLILQPLVENSIYHGLSEKHTNIHISVSLKKIDGILEFVVEDTGRGMENKELAKLRESISMDTKNDILYPPDKEGGYGLKNVNERIKIYFGEAYGIKIDSIKDKGTRVTVNIPEIRKRDD